MRTYKITVEYDGTNYNGWQVQKDEKNLATIQGELENVFQRILCKKIKITGSGRTDTGVHAKAQCASFKSDTKIPLWKIQKAVNTYLPEDIRVKAIKKVRDSFNARFSAEKKWYRYVILNQKVLSPINRYYSLHCPYKLDIKVMKKAAGILKGRHDFSGIVLTNDEDKVRNIYKLKVFEKNGFILIDIVGNGFLYKMARRITGVLLDAGRGKIGIDDVRGLLSRKKAKIDIQTAPAHGLTLMKVYY